MTKDQFKKRWESNDRGDGITNNDIADCAKEWGIFSTPRIQPMGEVVYRVLKAAEIEDAETFRPGPSKTA